MERRAGSVFFALRSTPYALRACRFLSLTSIDANYEQLPLRIVHLIDYFQPALGYQETFLAREQLRLGHEVTVVTSDRYAPLPNYASTVQPLLGERIRAPGQFIEADIPVWRLPVRFEQSYRCWLGGLAEALAALRPDIIHAHNVIKFSTLQAVLLKPGLGYRLLVDDHQHPLDLNKGRAGTWFYRLFRVFLAPLFRRRIDALVAVTGEIAGVVRHIYGLNNPAVQVIELGVDTELFQPDETARHMTRTKLGVNPPDFLVIYSGKIIPAKAVRWLVEALPHCPAQVKALLLGNPPIDYRRELEELIAAFGLADRVLFHPAVKQAELPCYYAAADAACWPRGVSIATLEVAACALPLIIAAQTLPERVSYDNGLEYEEGNVAALAGCLTQLAQNPEQARQMGLRGRQMVEENHSWTEINRQFMAAYQQSAHYK